MLTKQINASELLHKTIDGKERPKEETKEEMKEEVKKEPEFEFPSTLKCTHPVGGKCLHCIDAGKIKVEGIKH